MITVRQLKSHNPGGGGRSDSRRFVTKPLSRIYPAARGRVKLKIDPLPGALSTWTVPPCDCTICFTMESPSPVPPLSRLRPSSTR